MVWNLLDERNLVYSSFEEMESSIKAKVFGILVELSEGRIKDYRSDLWHDALWLNEAITGPMSFDWIVRDSGTFIGESAEQVDMSMWAGAIKYRFELVHNDSKWSVRIWEAVEDEVKCTPYSLELDEVFPTHENKMKGKEMDLDRLQDELQSSIEEAYRVQEQLEEKRDDLNSSIDELSGYIEDVEGVLKALERIPHISVYFEVDTITFDS